MKQHVAKVDLVTPGSSDISELNQYMISAKDVVAGYGTNTVLAGVNVNIRPGEIVGLVGPNGSDKSTLLQCMTGFLKLKSGNVTAAGKPLNALTRQEIARIIAFLPQRTDAIFGFSVMEMVMMGRHPYAGFGADDNREDVLIAQESLEELGVRHLAKRLFTELSGGEQQLVLLARSFAQRTPCLFLDEPLNGLDMAHQYTFMESLVWAGKAGKAIFATYHDLGVAARWCHRIILLKNGCVIAEGPPSQVITRETLAACYGVEANVVLKDEMAYPIIEITGLNRG